MMKVIVLLSFCFAAALAQTAGDCSNDVCTIAKSCRCSSSLGPFGNNLTRYPQLISFAFDEAVTADLVNGRWLPLFQELRNPDGDSVSATFFVPHEYTDYQQVNVLYNMGFEIGVHSITKNPFQTYWRNANETLLEQEFGGQKSIISKFANIPAKDIIGVRTPQLQLAGNETFKAYVHEGFAYDSSWPSLPSKPLFPYTLDYRSTQECLLGAECPTEAFPGFWVLPIIDLNGDGGECNALAACHVNGTAEEQAAWLLGEVDKVMQSTRAPLTLSLDSYWFESTPNSFEALQLFLKNVTASTDKFLVSQSRVLSWIKKPETLSDFKSNVPTNIANCNAFSCKLKNDNDEDRNMNSCVACPAKYPWIGNPDGNAK